MSETEHLREKNEKLRTVLKRISALRPCPDVACHGCEVEMGWARRDALEALGLADDALSSLPVGMTHREMEEENATLRARVAELESLIDSFWEWLDQMWDIEPREYFEKEAPSSGLTVLQMAMHHVWKRQRKGDEARCSECGGELSYCGEMGADGPTLDCKVCQLRARIAELEAEKDELQRWIDNVLQDHCENAYVEVTFYDAVRQALHSVAPEHPALSAPCPVFGVWSSLKFENKRLKDALAAAEVDAKAKAKEMPTCRTCRYWTRESTLSPWGECGWWSGPRLLEEWGCNRHQERNQ